MLRSQRIDFWDEDNRSLSLFRYKPGAAGESDPVTQFILGSKDPDSIYHTTATEEVFDALSKFLDQWKNDFDCRYFLPVPSHTAYNVPPASKKLCRFMARAFELQYPEDLLYRAISVPPAHMARSWERLTPPQHFESLRCSNADLRGAGVVLFDDVRTTGNTSQACRWRLQGHTNCGEVVRLFLGRVESID